ncbi:MAG: hypothetical protein ACOYN3_00700 [Acidimicrobiia bacterium]
MTWTTRDVRSLGIFVDSIHVAQDIGESGTIVVELPCDGTAHRIAIDGTDINGQSVGATRVTRTTASPSPTNAGPANNNPTSCSPTPLLQKMLSQFTVQRATQGITARSAQCAGNYVVVTFSTPSGIAKALFSITGVQVNLVGLPTAGGAAPTFVYQNCQLDPSALTALALPALVPTGGKGVQNCGPTAWATA